MARPLPKPANENAISKKSVLRGTLVWVGGLALSLVLGAFTDLMLSPTALQRAVDFQRSTLVAVESFTPGSIIYQIIMTFKEWSSENNSLPGATLYLITTLSDRLDHLSLLPGKIFFGLAMISFGLLLLVALVILIHDLREPTKHKRVGLWNGIGLTCLAGALFFMVTVLLIALILGILKWIALFALYTFGWLTRLAGIFAMFGTLASTGYFVIVKASEKRAGEVAESLLRRLVRPR